jgi:hypothetical protein
VALDIVAVTMQDCGTYVCRASNQLGQVETGAVVQVIAKSNVITETEHESAMQQISYLESHQEQRSMQMKSQVGLAFINQSNNLLFLFAMITNFQGTPF